LCVVAQGWFHEVGHRGWISGWGDEERLGWPSIKSAQGLNEQVFLHGMGSFITYLFVCIYQNQTLESGDATSSSLVTCTEVWTGYPYAKSTSQPSSLDTDFICSFGSHNVTQNFLMILLTCDYYIK